MQPDERPINPTQVTKPIQLLAAWLAGLIAINASFLGAAALIKSPTWAAGALVIAVIANVPVFLFCLFLLQTRFRPEMQEDSFYSKHLDRKFSEQSQKITVVSSVSSSSTIIPNPLKPLPININEALSQYVRVNDLLPEYADIIGALKGNGIRPADTFGSSSAEPVPPKKFVVSVGVNTPINLARTIIESMRVFGLDGVGIGQEYSDEDVIHIGAYSYDETEQYLPVNNADFSRILNRRTSKTSFFNILRKYEKFDETED